MRKRLIETLVLSAVVCVAAGGCRKKLEQEASNMRNRVAQKLSALAPPVRGHTARADQPAPTLAAASYVFWPNFTTTAGKEFAAGTAVAVKVPAAPGGVLVISCMHIFDEHTNAELPTYLKKVTLLDIDRKVIEIGAPIVVPGAKSFKLPDASTDLSVFGAPVELAAHALELATEDPAVGDNVWMLARVNGAVPPTALLHRAEVKVSDGKVLVYQFDVNSLEMMGTSGGPIVNSKGQLVAVNLGGGLAQGKLNIFGNPVSSVRKKIDLALARAAH